jgi:nucleotide-binding universal stress UspA family protein
MKLLHLNVVLAAVETDDSGKGVLQAAHELGDAAGAKVHIVHVAPSDGAVRERVESLLEHAGVPPNDVTVHVLTGDPGHVIRSLADRVRADVILLGKHRSRMGASEPFGSTALQVVTSSWAPCLILSNSMRLPLERVLAPVDLSDTSRGALVTALSWASALRGAEKGSASTPNEAATLTALLVDRSAPGGTSGSRQRQVLGEQLDSLRQDAGTWASVAIEGVVVSGSDVPSVIAEYSREHHADLVVLGTRGLGSDPVGRLGSISLGVGRQVDLPILLVPPAVWRSLSERSESTR